MPACMLSGLFAGPTLGREDYFDGPGSYGDRRHEDRGAHARCIFSESEILGFPLHQSMQKLVLSNLHGNHGHIPLVGLSVYYPDRIRLLSHYHCYLFAIWISLHYWCDESLEPWHQDPRCQQQDPRIQQVVRGDSPRDYAQSCRQKRIRHKAEIEKENVNKELHATVKSLQAELQKLMISVNLRYYYLLL